MKYLLACVLMLAPAFTWADEPGVITISGQGTVKSQPDQGYITLGVENVGKTSAEAVAANTALMKELFATLKGLGIKDEEIQTTDFTVSQNYKTVVEGKEHKTVKDGFRVTNMVSVTVCELDNFGKVLDGCVSSGANTVHSIAFGLSNQKEKLDEARKLAVADAYRKASIYARGLGVKLGKVKTVHENSHEYQPRRAMYGARAAMAESADVPVSGGSVSTGITVNIVWELVEVDETPIP